MRKIGKLILLITLLFDLLVWIGFIAIVILKFKEITIDNFPYQNWETPTSYVGMVTTVILTIFLGIKELMNGHKSKKRK